MELRHQHQHRACFAALTAEAVSTPTPESAAITTSNGNQSDSTPSWLSDFMQSLRSLYGAYALKDLVFYNS